jgi:hypothetical protein
MLREGTPTARSRQVAGYLLSSWCSDTLSQVDCCASKLDAVRTAALVRPACSLRTSIASAFSARVSLQYEQLAQTDGAAD